MLSNLYFIILHVSLLILCCDKILAFVLPPSKSPTLSSRCVTFLKRASSNHRRTIIIRKEGGDSDTTVAGIDSNKESQVQIPDVIKQPVLRLVYPSLLAHIEEYGHPNIPLGSSEGKKCSTLRRLYHEGKLSKDEISFLNGIEFRFISFDDMYYESDFDEQLQKLVNYKKNNDNYQVPKKYAPDPALGAWVINIRRLGPNNIKKEHQIKLNNIGFEWKSTRKCGSSFMNNLRNVRTVLEENEAKNSNNSDSNIVDVLSPDLIKWLNAQKEVNNKGNLSEMRVGYLDKLSNDFGFDWKKDL